MDDDTIHEGSGCVFRDLGVPCPPVKTPADEALIVAALDIKACTEKYRSAIKDPFASIYFPSTQLTDAEQRYKAALAAVRKERGHE